MSLSIFLSNIGIDELTSAHHGDTIMFNAIVSKLGNEMKNLFENSWRAFAKRNNLTADDTSIIGSHAVKRISSALYMTNFITDKQLIHGDHCPKSCFVGEEDSIVVFFSNMENRHQFLDDIKKIFNVTYDLSLADYVDSIFFSVDVIRLKLYPNLPSTNSHFVPISVDFVCKTKKKPILAFSNVTNLQMGPDDNDSIKPFKYNDNPLMQSPIGPINHALYMSSLLKSIETKHTELFIVPQTMFDTIYPSYRHDPSAYTRYWNEIIKRGQRMMEIGWSFKHLQLSMLDELCICNKNEATKYIYEMIEDKDELHTDLVVRHVCTTCKNMFCIWQARYPCLKFMRHVN